MTKQFTSLGFMSGTSGDGVDASIIRSNGVDQYEVIKEAFFEYDLETFKEIHSLKDKIILKDDLKKFKKEIIDLEKKSHSFTQRFSKNLVMKTKLISLGFMAKQFIIIRVKKFQNNLVMVIYYRSSQNLISFATLEISIYCLGEREHH